VVDDLAAVEQIKQVKAQHLRCMDTKQWDGWRDVFAPDASMDVTREAPQVSVVEGCENIIDFVSGHLEGVITCHHGHMPELELTSPTTATGIWAMEDHLWVPEGHPMGFAHLHGYGHYHETYERIDDRWFITTLELTRIRIDVTRR
jgi:hypothetical protein